MEHYVTLSRGYVVDVHHLPEDFDEKIKELFEKYTKGTAEDYRFHDQLGFIDLCVAYLHTGTSGLSYSTTAVDKYITGVMEYEWTENREIISREDIYSIETMEECYDLGMKNQCLYGKYVRDNERTNGAIMKCLIRIIRVVLGLNEKTPADDGKKEE